MNVEPRYPTLLRRHARNPILTAADWPYPVHTVFNPGATNLADGTTLLLCRVEDGYSDPQEMEDGIGVSIRVVQVWRDAARRATRPRAVQVGSVARLPASRVVRSAPSRVVAP